MSFWTSLGKSINRRLRSVRGASGVSADAMASGRCGAVDGGANWRREEGIVEGQKSVGLSSWMYTG